MAISSDKVKVGLYKAKVILYLKMHSQLKKDIAPKQPEMRRVLLCASGIAIAKSAIVKGTAMIKSIT